MPTESEERADLFLAIGEFVFEFSQLEFTIRHLVGSALELNDEAFNIIVSPYDFATLCRVANAFVRALPDCTDALAVHTERTFNACLKVNEERVRIAHVTWLLGAGARHVSRTTFKATSYYTTSEQIRKKSAEVQKLHGAVVTILIGEKSEWESISKRLDR
jgi:hypothetical protein